MRERVRGIEPPCAAWEAAVLPLNYTREVIFDFRFSIADCNRNNRTPAVYAVLSANKINGNLFGSGQPERFGTTAQNAQQLLPRNHVVGAIEARSARSTGGAANRRSLDAIESK